MLQGAKQVNNSGENNIQVSLDAASSNTAVPVSDATHRIATNGAGTLPNEASAQAPSSEEGMVIIEAADSGEGEVIPMIDPDDSDTITIEGTTIDTGEEITPTDNTGVEAIEAVPQDRQSWKDVFPLYNRPLHIRPRRGTSRIRQSLQVQYHSRYQ